ncbi:MAG: hypothetical protein HOE90_07065 [Bacteriovoracaceae bacterium]|jgi:hypothetical protein|nr:hypothetical protein [Bacteriovoracaceae bacterium]
MDFIKTFVITALAIASNCGHTKESKPKVLSTKQDISRIRFITGDGKFTFYQRKSGPLYVSTNYAVKKVLDGESDSLFLMSGSAVRKRLIVENIDHYYGLHSLNEIHNIFTTTIDGKKVTKVGQGLYPKLQLSDQWISYYLPHHKEIKVKFLEDLDISLSISLNVNHDHYFSPQVMMLSQNHILYTDKNANDQTGLFLFEKDQKKSKLIYKTPVAGVKVELCETNKYIIFGKFGAFSTKAGSTISVLKKGPDISIENQTIIYSSKQNDIGNIICNDQDEVFFVKDVSLAGDFQRKHDAFLVKIESKKLSRLTNSADVTQIFDLDGRILAVSKGKYLVLRGDYKTAKDSLNE